MRHCPKDKNKVSDTRVNEGKAKEEDFKVDPKLHRKEFPADRDHTREADCSHGTQGVCRPFNQVESLG